MCPDCNAITHHKRGSNGHAHLVVTGQTDAKPIERATIHLTFYRCSVCGTKWRYIDDKSDPFAGWSVPPSY